MCSSLNPILTTVILSLSKLVYFLVVSRLPYNDMEGYEFRMTRQENSEHTITYEISCRIKVQWLVGNSESQTSQIGISLNPNVR